VRQRIRVPAGQNAQGMSDRQIANALGISEKTVRSVIDLEELEYRPPREP
jgi:transposase